MREVAKDVVETKDFGKVACPDGRKCWPKLSPEELKNIGPRSQQRKIRDALGTKEDAWEFFRTQVGNSPITQPDPGVFVGTDINGIRFTYRAISKSEGHWPTIDIVGIDGLKKIKFKN